MSSYWLLVSPSVSPDLGSSVILGFSYCLDHLCTLCQNSHNLFDPMAMLLCGFHWHSRCVITDRVRSKEGNIFTLSTTGGGGGTILPGKEVRGNHPSQPGGGRYPVLARGGGCTMSGRVYILCRGRYASCIHGTTVCFQVSPALLLSVTQSGSSLWLPKNTVLKEFY